MNISAIISEYNPFHNGHKYLAEKARKNGATHIIAIMGGNFLQRGECAVMDKYARARAAVLGGVDLVLELPVIYGAANAEQFAAGAVKTLDKCGCIDSLCFGSECGDINKIQSAVKLTQSEEFVQTCIDHIANGFSHPRAMQAAAEKLCGNTDITGLFAQPNDTLGIEYVRALNNIKSKILPKPVGRIAVNHNSKYTVGIFASASKIRSLILNKDVSCFDYMPDTTAEIIKEQIEKGLAPVDFSNKSGAVLSVLRRMSKDDLKNLPDVNEGLENRLYRAVRESASVEEIISKAKCKRYTYTRLSRIIVCAYLGIDKQTASITPQYIRPLAFNDKGTEILKEMKSKAELPVIMSLRRDREKLSEQGKKLLDKDILASDLYRLLTPKIYPCASDYYNGVIKITCNTEQ